MQDEYEQINFWNNGKHKYIQTLVRKCGSYFAS